MKQEKTDRRSQRTKRLLAEAFTSLLREKTYDQIGVQDIIERADVGRSTFYAHYQDKEDLLVSELERMLDQLNAHASLDGFFDPNGSPVKQLFTHVQDYQPLYKALAWSKDIETLFKKGQAHLSKDFERLLTSSTQYRVSATVPLPVVCNYMAGSLVNLLRWWLDNNQPYSPEQMDTIFHQLVMPGLWGMLEKK